MAGCAKALTANFSGATPNDSTGTFRTKGISYFGPRSVDRWLAEFGSLAQPEQIGALIQLASLPIEESRREAVEAIERFTAEASPADRALAVEYLTAVPLAVRRSLVPDPNTGRFTLRPRSCPAAFER